LAALFGGTFLAALFGGTFHWPHFLLAALFIGRTFYWPQFLLAALFIGGTFWLHFLLSAVFFGGTFFWRHFSCSIFPWHFFCCLILAAGAFGPGASGSEDIVFEMSKPFVFARGSDDHFQALLSFRSMEEARGSYWILQLASKCGSN
jgi:hypothetical protein